MTGIPTKTEAELAAARASSQRRRTARSAIVRVVGDGAGCYTISELAARLGTSPETALGALRHVRRLRLAVTWSALQRRVMPRSA